MYVMATKTKLAVLFSIALPITHEFIDTLLTTAFEGGIRYWAGEYKETGGAKLNKHDLDAHEWYADRDLTFCYELKDTETGKWFTSKETYWAVDELDRDKSYAVHYRHLTYEALREGLQKWAEVNWATEDYHGMPNIGSIDADVADSIIQYAVFGGLVFG